ncbi:MAG: hypothetical protein HLUCCA01_05025 [Bacteroidetes bacterium HLUCCA01]|nr:MAG: hypothetical protein HLUCCA01_05025 [Bacteroidetes bacterium HLUCCA01]
MKNSKNTLVAATLTFAIALGCANFIDMTGETTVQTPGTGQEVAAVEIESTLSWGAREDIIIIRPD